jgi:hypothetical protein
VSGSTSRRWLPWLNQWGWPFVWILLIPMATVFWSAVLLQQALDEGICTFVPIAGERIVDQWRCPREDVSPTLLPGLLNLVAFSWVLSGQREVRWAALVAGTLGAVRLAAPLLIYGLSGAYVDIGDLRPIIVFAQGSSVLASWVLWGLSAVSALVFVVRAEIVESKERRQAATANQARAQDERAQLLTRLRDEGLITDEEYERQARAQGLCKNCGKRLTVDDKLRSRGTGLCWGCLSGPSSGP